jgi:hypothetical protein
MHVTVNGRIYGVEMGHSARIHFFAGLTLHSRKNQETYLEHLGGNGAMVFTTCIERWH